MHSVRDTARKRPDFGGTDWAAQLHADEVPARVFLRQTDAPAVPAGTVLVLAVQDSNTGTMNASAAAPRNGVPPLEIAATRTGADGTHTAILVTIAPGTFGFGPTLYEFVVAPIIPR